MSKLDIDYDLLTQLRDMLVLKRDSIAQLRMNTYVNVPEKQNDGHFCASAACVLGWGAVSKLQQHHPMLAPLYQFIELAETTIPHSDELSPIHYHDVYTDLYTVLSQLYSGMIMKCTGEYTMPALPEIPKNTNWADFKGVLARSGITDIPSDAVNQRSNEHESAWEFMFGTRNPNCIDHAIWRLTYVIENCSSPLFYSLIEHRATNTTVRQLLELEGGSEVLYDLYPYSETLQVTDQFIIPTYLGEFTFLEYKARDALVELCTKNGDIWLTK